MKAIHPDYHSDAIIKCQNCDAKHSHGGTRTDIQIEICSKCHPFYTGKKVLIDTEGRVDKFRMKMDSAGGRKKKVRKKKTLADKVNEELTAQSLKDAAKAAKEEEEKAAKKAAKAGAAPVVEEKVEVVVEETPEVVEEEVAVVEEPAAEEQAPAEETE